MVLDKEGELLYAQEYARKYIAYRAIGSLLAQPDVVYIDVHYHFFGNFKINIENFCRKGYDSVEILIKNLNRRIKLSEISAALTNGKVKEQHLKVVEDLKKVLDV